jgi:type II secretory pathway component GspD/PulD (secretin)
VPCEVIKTDVAIGGISKSSSLSFGINGISTIIPNNNLINILTASSNVEAGAKDRIKTKGSIAGHFGMLKRTVIDNAIDALEPSGNGQAISGPSVLILDNFSAILETDKVHYSTISGTNNSNAYIQFPTV